jgi:hypothetical protein
MAMNVGEQARWPHAGNLMKRLAAALMVIAAAIYLVASLFLDSQVLDSQVLLGKVLPVGGKVSGSVLSEHGFDRVCFELTPDPALQRLVSHMYDLFGGRMSGYAHIVFFTGAGRPRYAHVRNLFVNPLPSTDCLPLSRVALELQPSSRYEKQRPATKRRTSTGYEDFYLWMTIGNTHE